MRKKIILISLFFLLVFYSPLILSGVHAQAITGNTLEGLNQTANQVAAFQAQTNQTFTADFFAGKIGQIIGVVLSFVGVLFLILMIYGGILWMTAAGNEEQVKKARGLMFNALIGLVIVLAAYALTAFIGRGFGPQ